MVERAAVGPSGFVGQLGVDVAVEEVVRMEWRLTAGSSVRGYHACQLIATANASSIDPTACSSSATEPSGRRHVRATSRGDRGSAGTMTLIPASGTGRQTNSMPPRAVAVTCGSVCSRRPTCSIPSRNASACVTAHCVVGRPSCSVHVGSGEPSHRIRTASRCAVPACVIESCYRDPHTRASPETATCCTFCSTSNRRPSSDMTPRRDG